ncbi:MAG: glutathione S-transferase family protein [SAR86 cluster bacterium]|nr:glutathione S-transferase family protein [SAR86 cluster bacterium]|tara:strand:- start:390 stop:1013 length:624 start_codon:yes stop_codon:yes gene_type:complete
MTIKIYSCAGSRGMRPIWTAEEMGLDYEVEMMPFPPRFLHKEFMDINILGTVPYMIDGEVHMTESVAMSQYMVDRYGPSDLKVNTNEDDYGNYLNWLSHSDATLTFPQTVFLRYTFQEIGVADEAADGYKRWFIARLKLLEKSLNTREYLCSNRFTIADICVSYALFLAKSLGIDEAFKPNITRWTNMLFERDAFKKIKNFSHEEIK